jgi:hypothetical protein
VQKQFHSHQNTNTSASFLFLATTRGFAFWLDIVCVAYVAIVIMSFLVLGSGEYILCSIRQQLSFLASFETFKETGGKR